MDEGEIKAAIAEQLTPGARFDAWRPSVNVSQGRRDPLLDRQIYDRAYAGSVPGDQAAFWQGIADNRKSYEGLDHLDDPLGLGKAIPQGPGPAEQPIPREALLALQGASDESKYAGLPPEALALLRKYDPNVPTDPNGFLTRNDDAVLAAHVASLLGGGSDPVDRFQAAMERAGANKPNKAAKKRRLSGED
jgi:hypothetical protein